MLYILSSYVDVGDSLSTHIGCAFIELPVIRWPFDAYVHFNNVYSFILANPSTSSPKSELDDFDITFDNSLGYNVLSLRSEMTPATTFHFFK